jgi:hypothetical protein
VPGEIFDFEWFVHAEGYNWLEADFSLDTAGVQDRSQGGSESGRMPWITVAGESTSLNLLARRKYFPLRDYSCLFRIFAETVPEAEGILAFANTYGLLGIELDEHPGKVVPYMGTAEPAGEWETEIRAMQKAVGLWDMVSAEDNQGVRDYLLPFVEIIKADVDGADPSPELLSRLEDDAEAGELRWFRTHPEIAELFEKQEFKLIALSRVQAIVNERLGSRVSPRILWDDYRKGDWGLYFVPDNLVGAIWIQFAQAITENRDYRRCRQCDSWFEIDHYKARTNRYFCSNACRSKAYRLRQQQAVKLAEAGMDVEEIAKKLGSDVETVNKWIG